MEGAGRVRTGGERGRRCGGEEREDEKVREEIEITDDIRATMVDNVINGNDPQGTAQCERSCCFFSSK